MEKKSFLKEFRIFKWAECWIKDRKQNKFCFFFVLRKEWMCQMRIEWNRISIQLEQAVSLSVSLMWRACYLPVEYPRSLSTGADCEQLYNKMNFVSQGTVLQRYKTKFVSSASNYDKLATKAMERKNSQLYIVIGVFLFFLWLFWVSFEFRSLVIMHSK